MVDEADNTTVEIANLLESPEPSPQKPPEPTGQDPPLEEILASSTELIQTFAASISQSAMKEANKTEEFRKGILQARRAYMQVLLTARPNRTAEFKRRLYRAIIGTFVWSTARLAHETEAAEGRLAQGVQVLLSEEREQGRSSPPAATLFGSSVSGTSIVSADLPDKIDFVRVSRSWWVRLAGRWRCLRSIDSNCLVLIVINGDDL